MRSARSAFELRDDARVRFEIDSDPSLFAAAARPFLEARVEHNLLATVVTAVLAGRHRGTPPMLVRCLDDQDRLTAVAIRTPPWPMLPSELDGDGARALTALWLDRDPACAGVTAPAATARAIAAAWAQLTGVVTTCGRRTAMHSLQAVVDPPRRAPGRLRAARRRELGLLAEWWRAAVREMNSPGHAAAEAEAMLSARLDDGCLWLWEDAVGEPVSMVGVNAAVAGVVRVGPVYTPPQQRRRGYAGAAVAAVSRRMLGGGAHTCALFTDLANPTSNKIYAELGYRRLSDWEEHLFSAPEPSGGPTPLPSGGATPAPEAHA
ncbi:MAG: GNAT family N-acetyltransferase [Solirubrobacteraceae bacterium]